MFDNYWLTIDQEQYIWDKYGDQTICVLLIMPNKYDFYVMGQPLFQGYYVEHDMQS